MQEETLQVLAESGEVKGPDWSQFPIQLDFLSDPHMYKMFSGGFSIGKSTALCNFILWMLTIPKNLGYLGRLDGKALRQSTFQLLLDMLPADTYKKNDQQGMLTMKPSLGGARLLYGDFKDERKIKNIELGFFAVEQAEEIPLSVWDLLCGRLRRMCPIRSPEGKLQYYVEGVCPSTNYRHLAQKGDKLCRDCGEKLPRFNLNVEDPQTSMYPPWKLKIYNRFGVGVCNPDSPEHWIYQMFPGFPNGKGELSEGSTDSKFQGLVKGFHATTYDALQAGIIDPDYVMQLEAKYTTSENMYERFMLGQWVQGKGLVYPEFRNDLHIISQHAQHYAQGKQLIPIDAPVYEYIDPGAVNPTAIGWVAIFDCDCGCSGQNVIILDESYEAKKPVSYHCTVIRHKRSQIPQKIQGTYMDRASFGKHQVKEHADGTNELWGVADEYMELGIHPLATNKSWDAGRNRISELLKVDPNHINPLTGQAGAPHLLVKDCCPNVIFEFQTYSWKDRPGIEEPRDKDDHHMDGLNNLLVSRPMPETNNWNEGQDKKRRIRQMMNGLAPRRQLTHMSL